MSRRKKLTLNCCAELIHARAMPLVRIARRKLRRRLVETAVREEITRAHQTNLACRRDGQRIPGQRRRARMRGIQTQWIGDDPDVRSNKRSNHNSRDQTRRNPRDPGLPPARSLIRYAAPLQACRTWRPGRLKL